MEAEQFYIQARSEMLEQIEQHTAMVSEYIERPRLSARVMAALESVPRHEFVLAELRMFAYLDQPLPIGFGKTISQPFIVALMTDLLDPQPTDRVLDVGTGLGYQAAVLAQLTGKVYSVEIIEELAQEAGKKLLDLGYDNIQVRIGDGCRGWLDAAPFDKILVAAAPELIPPALLHQLKPGGRMVIPAGMDDTQQLIVVDKSGDGTLSTREVLAVRFSHLTLTN